MKYCKKCGEPVSENDKFCGKCGSLLDNLDNTTRKIVFEGDIHKCPNCGAIVPSFKTYCTECGFEFRNSQSSHAVKEFAEKLEIIEAKRKPNKIKKMNFFKSSSNNKLSDIDEQKINLIKNFSVPNNKEDILEFLTLSLSNIDPVMYNPNIAKENPVQKAISDAWKTKTDHVFLKAEMMLDNDSDFRVLKETYKQKNIEIKKYQFKPYRDILLVIVGWILFFAFLIIMSIFFD
ncbi:MAG: zinc ribbon domain-containing protein [Erysipelotrichaceae bacterium]|nr:zinc ribbon domain-containing protein [Erysipelotrichaceae bacterium]